MPIVARIFIPIKSHNGTIEILKKKLDSCGCLDLVVESRGSGTSVEHLLKEFNNIDGVVCNDAGMCCATDVQHFADKLKKFRGES